MKRCRWVKPVIVCQIKFTEWTRDDRLRHPVFLGIRTGKKADEVVREKGKLITAQDGLKPIRHSWLDNPPLGSITTKNERNCLNGTRFIDGKHVSHFLPPRHGAFSGVVYHRIRLAP
jgi:hypothetical protein